MFFWLFMFSKTNFEGTVLLFLLFILFKTNCDGKGNVSLTFYDSQGQRLRTAGTLEVWMRRLVQAFLGSM